MKEVRNSNGKLVCQVDEKQKSIEIVHKGYITIVRFCDDGRIVVYNGTAKL